MHPSSAESVAWVDAVDDAYLGVAWVYAVDDAYPGVAWVDAVDDAYPGAESGHGADHASDADSQFADPSFDFSFDSSDAFGSGS